MRKFAKNEKKNIIENVMNYYFIDFCDEYQFS